MPGYPTVRERTEHSMKKWAEVNGAPLTLAQITQRATGRPVGTEAGAVRYALRRLLRQGRARRVARGRYVYVA